MSATFTCPHCGAVYPFKPVLIGRAVRCTTCRNAFSLRADGIADKVGGPAAAPAAVATASAPAPAPRPAPTPAAPAPVTAPTAPPRPTPPKPPPRPVVPAQPDQEIEIEFPAAAKTPPPTSPPLPVKSATPPVAPAPTTARSAPAQKPPAGKPDSGDADEGREQSARLRATQRMTSQQQDTRRNMAATLAVSMNAALKAESAKKESESKAQQEKKKAIARGDGSVGRIGPVLLTGEGASQARLERAWWLYGSGSLLLIIALGWLLGHHGPRQQAIDAFTAVVEGKRNHPGERVQAIQERAWLATMPPANIGVPAITEMPDVHHGALHTITLASVRGDLATLKGLTLIEPQHIWLPADTAGQLLADWNAETKPEAFIAALTAKGKPAVGHRSLLAKLEADGLSSEDVAVIDLFLRGRGPGGTTPVLTRWLAGDFPERIELSVFYGTAGTLIIEQGGQAYKPRTVPYSGQLLRFIGKDWPSEWRVLTLTTVRN